MRRRLDAELVRRGLATSGEEARSTIAAGLVTVDGVRMARPSTLVAKDEPVAISRPAERFVSRGGEKLEGALDRFGVDPAERDCLDAGASTGGFTDCLLARGAARVAAVDVGYGQLHWRLRTDERVVVLERTNVRHLEASSLPFRPQLLVADLSFISLRLVIPSLGAVAAPGADLVLLVKPQFEAARVDVAPGGVVRDPAVWVAVTTRVMDACLAHGLRPQGVMASPKRRPAGNAEFFLYAVATDASAARPDVGAAVEEALSLSEPT